MESKNSFSLDIASNEEMRKLFIGKQPGESVTLETTFVVSEVSETLATGTISEVTPIGGDPGPMDDEDDGPVPAAAVVIANSKAKK